MRRQREKGRSLWELRLEDGREAMALFSYVQAGATSHPSTLIGSVLKYLTPWILQHVGHW